MTDPKGQPGCFREMDERLPVCCRWTKVLARSAWEGSGTSGPSASGPLLCWREEDTMPLFYAMTSGHLTLDAA